MTLGQSTGSIHSACVGAYTKVAYTHTHSGVHPAIIALSVSHTDHKLNAMHPAPEKKATKAPEKEVKKVTKKSSKKSKKVKKSKVPLAQGVKA